jgi:hypothetical protein
MIFQFPALRQAGLMASLALHCLYPARPWSGAMGCRAGQWQGSAPVAVPSQQWRQRVVTPLALALALVLLVLAGVSP